MPSLEDSLPVVCACSPPQMVEGRFLSDVVAIVGSIDPVMASRQVGRRLCATGSARLMLRLLKEAAMEIALRCDTSPKGEKSVAL